MYTRSLVLAIILGISLLPLGSYSEGRTTARSFENINTSAITNGSIVIINEEQTSVPDYVHTEYAFVDQLCGSQLVDHYGPPVNPNDKDLKRAEQRLCMEIAMNSDDGE
jgi:hypothetical protein